ncbi:SRC2-like protein [Tanacetum coccineum]
MECSRNLELRLVSAEGLKNRSWTSKSNVYAVVSISGSRNKKLKTPVDKSGGLEPTWNHPMNFTIDEAAGLQNRLTLLVKIKSVGMLSDKNLGEVRLPMKELLEGIKDEGKAMQLVSYQVTRKSKKPRGSVTAVVRGVMIVVVGSWETLYLMLILVIIMAVDVVAVLVVVAIVVAAIVVVAVVVATDEAVN